MARLASLRISRKRHKMRVMMRKEKMLRQSNPHQYVLVPKLSNNLHTPMF